MKIKITIVGWIILILYYFNVCVPVVLKHKYYFPKLMSWKNQKHIIILKFFYQKKYHQYMKHSKRTIIKEVPSLHESYFEISETGKTVFPRTKLMYDRKCTSSARYIFQDKGIWKALFLHDTYSEITSKIYSLIKEIKEAQ